MRAVLLIFVVLFLYAPAYAQHDGPFDFPAIAGDREPYVGPHYTFRGSPCKRDCANHKAGYAWAEEHDILDTEKCQGENASFVKGCLIWVQEHGTIDYDVEDGPVK